MAGGGLAAGMLYDLSGSYTSSWILSVVSGLVTAFVAMDLKAPSRPSTPTERTASPSFSSTPQAALDTPRPQPDRVSGLFR
jgi:hypothetical protein